MVSDTQLSADDPQGPAVEITSLQMRYGDLQVVDSLDMQISRHTITAVLGPNGAGKTTTLETCEGFRAPHGGAVRVLGLDPIADKHALVPRIGVMLQNGGAWAAIRPRAMLQHLASLHREPLDVDELIERLGLQRALTTPYRQLSGGQKQRLGLAMAIVGRPELVFIDEPTAGMDPTARRSTWELLSQLREDGVTVVLTTHYMDEAEQLADHIHVLNKGRLIASGSPSELLAGESNIEIRTNEPISEFARAQLVALLGASIKITVTGRCSLRVLGAGETNDIGKLSTWFMAHKLTIESLHIGRRRLEDVFFQLTEETSPEAVIE